MTVFLYTFRERETIYDLFEEICGARFTVSYMRVGGVGARLARGMAGPGGPRSSTSFPSITRNTRTC